MPRPSCDQQRASQSVKIYGSLCTAAISQRHDSALRLWHLARMIDSPGSGVVDYTVLMDVIGRYISTSARHIRRLVAEAEALGWLEKVQRRNGEHVVLITSLERLSLSLGVSPSQGALIPAQQLRKLKAWRGAAWAAFLAGRSGRRERPISRRVLEKLSGVDARSQLNYERASKVIRSRRNIAITRLSSDKLDGVIDVEGRSAFPVGRWLGWQLPNSYSVRVDLAPRGMARKVCKRLSEGLLQNAATDSAQRQRLFYSDPRSGDRAMRRADRTVAEVYAFSGGHTEQGSSAWEHMPA